MTTETLKRQCIEHLTEIAEPGLQVCLTPEDGLYRSLVEAKQKQTGSYVSRTVAGEEPLSQSFKLKR